LISHFASGQILQDKELYFKGSGILGNYFGGKISLEYINKKDYSFSLGVSGQGKKYQDLPSDYISPSGILAWVNFGLDYPQEEWTTFYITLGKVLKTRNDKIRFNLSSGLAFNNLKYPSDFKKITPVSTSENYSYSYLTKNSPGIIINPTVEFAIWNYFRFSTGLISNISPNRCSVGFEAALLLGIVRNKTFIKKNPTNENPESDSSSIN
jgi:hypothetical protein